MASAPKANAVVGQSGGPTGVINASLVGVIEEAQKHPEIENLYGAIHAVAGIVKDEFIDLKKLSAKTLEVVAASPVTILQIQLISSTRWRIKPTMIYGPFIFPRRWTTTFS